MSLNNNRDAIANIFNLMYTENNRQLYNVASMINSNNNQIMNVLFNLMNNHGNYVFNRDQLIIINCLNNMFNNNNRQINNISTLVNNNNYDIIYGLANILNNSSQNHNNETENATESANENINVNENANENINVNLNTNNRVNLRRSIFDLERNYVNYDNALRNRGPVNTYTYVSFLTDFLSNFPAQESSEPLSDEQIANVTRHVRYSDITHPLNTTCPISLEEFNDNDFVTVIRPCCHIFKSEQLSVWLRTHTTCPSCRFNLRNWTPN